MRYRKPIPGVLWTLCSAAVLLGACSAEPGGDTGGPTGGNGAVADQDGDAIADRVDNCPNTSNPVQGDLDGDGIGNSCDNCVDHPNGDQQDSDGDGLGDVCDALIDEPDQTDDPTPDDNDSEDTTNFSVPDGFPPALKVKLGTGNTTVVEGVIRSGNDVEVFDLGAMAMGDRLEVRCAATSGSGLDPMIALFDDDGYRVFWNDDISLATGNFDAGFDGIIRHDSPNYFLGVTTTNFITTTGQFRCVLETQPQVGLASIQGQRVVLRWTSSGNVVVTGESWGAAPAFNAANVSFSFDGQTQEMQDAIVEVVRDDFADLEVDISTTDDALPTGGYTTVYFGFSTPMSIYGIADDVDFYNGDHSDNAVVFWRPSGASAAAWS